MSTNTKLRKTQISKIVQSGRSFGSWLPNQEPNATIPFARDNLAGLVSNITSKTINKFERKISRKRARRTGKRFLLFISNKDMNEIIEVVKSLEDPGVLMVLLKQLNMK